MAAIEHTGHAASQKHTLCPACQQEAAVARDAVLQEADLILTDAGVDPRGPLFPMLKTRILKLVDQ